MPYGLSNTPSVFQCLINDVLRDMLGRSIIHTLMISCLLCILRGACQPYLAGFAPSPQLYVKAEKCEFHRHMISFLGYAISQKGVIMDQSKVQAVVEWPAPKTVCPGTTLTGAHHLGPHSGGDRSPYLPIVLVAQHVQGGTAYSGLMLYMCPGQGSMNTAHRQA